MSYWSHHPEELDEATTKFLPEPWKTQVEEDEIELTDVPDDILFKAMDEGVADYWSSMADAAMARVEEDLIAKAESDFEPI